MNKFNLAVLAVVMLLTGSAVWFLGLDKSRDIDGNISKTSIEIDSRQDWVEIKSRSTTRITYDGDLKLDDKTLFKDNFSNRSTVSGGDFDWHVEEPGDSNIRMFPNEDGGYVRFNTTERGQQAYIQQQNGFFYNVSRHGSWRYTIIESASQPTLDSAWEFFLNEDDFDTRTPWLLVDAGGKGKTEFSEDEDCGSFIWKHEDQLLTRFYKSGSEKFCWDEYSMAPLNHTKKQEMTLELLSNEGVVNAYVNGRLAASLNSSKGMFIMDGTNMTVHNKLHDKGDHEELGFLYYAEMEKVGIKEKNGYYESKFIDVGNEVDWEEVKVEAAETNDSKFEIDYGIRSESEVNFYDDIRKVPNSSSIMFNISMSTSRETETPSIDMITIDY